MYPQDDYRLHLSELHAQGDTDSLCIELCNPHDNNNIYDEYKPTINSYGEDVFNE